MRYRSIHAALCLFVVAACTSRDRRTDAVLDGAQTDVADVFDASTIIDAAMYEVVDAAPSAFGGRVIALQAAVDLLESPTEMHLRSAASEHVLSVDETASVAAAWAFLIVAKRDGGLNPLFFEMRLPERLAQIAGNYPTYFAVEPGPKALPFISGPSDFSCTGDCSPVLPPLKLLGWAASIATHSDFLTNSVRYLDAIDRGYSIGADVGQVLGMAFTEVDGPDFILSLASLISVPALGTAAILGAPVAGAAAAVGIAFAVGSAANDLSDLYFLNRKCLAWKPAHCCGTAEYHPEDTVCCDAESGRTCPLHSACTACNGVPQCIRDGYCCGATACPNDHVCLRCGGDIEQCLPAGATCCGDGVCQAEENPATCSRDCSCPAGTCSPSCAQLGTNDNCATCGNACASPTTCVAGACLDQNCPRPFTRDPSGFCSASVNAEINWTVTPVSGLCGWDGTRKMSLNNQQALYTTYGVGEHTILIRPVGAASGVYIEGGMGSFVNGTCGDPTRRTEMVGVSDPTISLPEIADASMFHFSQRVTFSQANSTSPLAEGTYVMTGGPFQVTLTRTSGAWSFTGSITSSVNAEVEFDNSVNTISVSGTITAMP